MDKANYGIESEGAMSTTSKQDDLGRSVAAERKEFEAWASQVMSLNITPNDSCGYVSEATNGAWMAWGAQDKENNESLIGDTGKEREVTQPSDAEIDEVFNAMPGGVKGWLIDWGYQQFARALLERFGQSAERAEAGALADYVADTWPDKKYTLEEIEERLRDLPPQAITQTAASEEPIEYQFRMRAMWMDEGKGWTVWERCTEAVYRSLLKNPIHHGQWQYEVRDLHTVPPDAQAIRDAALEAAAEAAEGWGESLYVDSTTTPWRVARYRECADGIAAEIRALKGGAA